MTQLRRCPASVAPGHVEPLLGTGHQLGLAPVHGGRLSIAEVADRFVAGRAHALVAPTGRNPAVQPGFGAHRRVAAAAAARC
jgi:hypothetical protein